MRGFGPFSIGGDELKYSKFMVTLIILLNIGFAAAVLFVNFKGGSVADSLIVAWYGFTATELWNMAKIKINKVKGENKNE